VDYYKARWQGTLKPLTKVPYLRRDRHCEVEGTPLTQDGPRDQSYKYTHTYGIEKTVAESFALTMGIEIGTDTFWSDISVSIEASYSRDYSSTIMEANSSETTKSYTIPGDETWLFLSWTCVDEYSITDKDGNPYTDPNYKFEDFVSAKISGTAKHDKIYVFKK
jgi:hypothetical protein